MLGIVVEVLLSWLLLWLFYRQHLSALGVVPTVSRIVDYLVGLCLSAFFCATHHLLSAALAGDAWVMNENILITQLAASVRWVFQSVLFETLIFHGALLYIATRKLGAIRACILSAACFGVYHWFSYNVFGNPVQMAIIFLMTALAGLTFAFAFIKTGSLYLPVALHLTWNCVNIIIFSRGPLGDQMFVRQHDFLLEGIPSLVLLLFSVIGLPLATYGYLRVSKKKHATATLV
jgi:membrane protease YdiL (CAAX protease family)